MIQKESKNGVTLVGFNNKNNIMTIDVLEHKSSVEIEINSMADFSVSKKDAAVIKELLEEFLDDETPAEEEEEEILTIPSSLTQYAQHVDIMVSDAHSFAETYPEIDKLLRSLAENQNKEIRLVKRNG